MIHAPVQKIGVPSLTRHSHRAWSADLVVSVHVLNDQAAVRLGLCSLRAPPSVPTHFERAPFPSQTEASLQVGVRQIEEVASA
eukprot:1379171-Rhodomonas_salina.5